MTQGYRLRKNESFGRPVPLGFNPVAGADLAPSVPPFVAMTVEAVVRDSGFPVILCGGDCPSLDDLDGWMLVVSPIGRDLVFGGVHRKVRVGPEAPFQRFFVVPDVPASLQGLLAAAAYVDVVFVAEDGSCEGFVFTHVRSAVLLGRAEANQAFSRRRAADGSVQ